MAVEKLSISVEESLAAAIRNAARQEGKPLSAWVADAVAARLRNAALGEALEEWQAEHGRIPEGEIVAAEVRLGLRPSSGSQTDVGAA
jgi:hypothetical protein